MQIQQQGRRRATPITRSTRPICHSFTRQPIIPSPSVASRPVPSRRAMPPKPAPIFSQPSPVIPRHPNHQHDIVTALVAVETLDTLPGDLTKTFGDLRELDAVLNSTTASLTHKLRSLTRALQAIHPDINPGWGLPLASSPKSAPQASGTDAGSVSASSPIAGFAFRQAEPRQSTESSASRPLNRFQSLLEIAEELTRYKIGESRTRSGFLDRHATLYVPPSLFFPSAMSFRL